MKTRLRSRFLLFALILIGVPALVAVLAWLLENFAAKSIFGFYIVMGLNMYFLPAASVCPSGFTSGEFVIYPKNALGVCATILIYTALAFALAWLMARTCKRAQRHT